MPPLDWSAIGAAAAGLLVGGAGWFRERKNRKRAVRPWDGETERRDSSLVTRERLTGRGLVLMIEDSGAEMPRHWVTFVDGRVEHKMRNALAPITAQVAGVESDVREIKDSLTTLTRIANRLIGRLLPDEPVD